MRSDFSYIRHGNSFSILPNNEAATETVRRMLAVMGTTTLDAIEFDCFTKRLRAAGWTIRKQAPTKLSGDALLAALAS